MPVSKCFVPGCSTGYNSERKRFAALGKKVLSLFTCTNSMEDNFNAQLDLPPEASHYSFRIAGHTHSRGKIKLGLLKHNNGNILKPLLSDDSRSARELSFYKQIHENSESDPILSELKNFIPLFHGIWETTINGTDIKYLCIEDICGTFQNPSILDIKIGSITYDCTASEEKILRETKKYPPLEIFGFRILGMKVYDHCKQVYISTDKVFGLKLNTSDAVTTGLERFYSNKMGQINCLILSGFYHKLMQLKSWFEKQRKFVFISSSLLFVYEGNIHPWISWMNENSLHINSELCKKNYSKDCISLHYSNCDPVLSSSSTQIENEDVCSDCYLSKSICNSLQRNCPLIRISMVDFAHLFPTLDIDSNYLFGLNNLMSYWQQVIKNSIQNHL